MSLLSICQAAVDNCGLDRPVGIVGNPDPAAVRLLQLARRTVRSLASEVNWTNLVTEHIFFADGQSDYPLPPDFRSMISDTAWDRSMFWPMRGALSPQQWQMYKSSVIGQALVEQRWRIRIPSGAVAGAPAVFSIDPKIIPSGNAMVWGQSAWGAPTTWGPDRAGNEFVFEYVSNYAIRSATTFSLEEAVVAASGQNYSDADTITLAGGTSTIPATVLVTSVNDAGSVLTGQIQTPGVYTVAPISPAVQASSSGMGTGASFTITTTTAAGTAIPDWAADTDTCILDEDLVELGVIYRLLARLGLAYGEEKDEYRRQVDQAIARDGGTSVLTLTQRVPFSLIGLDNIQDGSWPGSR